MLEKFRLHYTQESNIRVSYHRRYVTLRVETFCLYVYKRCAMARFDFSPEVRRICHRSLHERRERILIPVANLSTACSCFSLLIHTYKLWTRREAKTGRQLCGAVCKFTQLVLSAPEGGISVRVDVCYNTYSYILPIRLLEFQIFDKVIDRDIHE